MGVAVSIRDQIIGAGGSCCCVMLLAGAIVWAVSFFGQGFRWRR